MTAPPSPDDVARAALLHETTLHVKTGPYPPDPRWPEATRLQRLGLLRVRPDSRTTATLLLVRPPDPAPEPVAEPDPPPVVEQDGFHITPPTRMAPDEGKGCLTWEGLA